MSTVRPVPELIMQELIARLMTALSTGGPNSAAVQQVLREINVRYPDQTDTALAIVAGWPAAARTGQSGPSDSGMSFTSWKFIAPVLASLGIGGAGAQFVDTNSVMRFFATLPLPQVSNRWELLGVVAAVGAVFGLGYSFYRNNWTLILPTFSRTQSQFKVASWGSLRNVVMAALAAVATTWLALSNGPPAAQDANLLTWSVLGSAVVAGIVGSRMTSGEVEKSVLWEALSTAADQQEIAGLGKLVSDAKTPLDAAAIATGSAVPGVKPPKEISVVRQVTDPEAKLLSNFDRPALKNWLLKRTVPVGRDGSGLPLDTLAEVQRLNPAIKPVLTGLEIVPVASMPLDSFLAELNMRGIDAAGFQNPLGGVQRQAVMVRDGLGALPTDWTLSVDLL